MDTKNGWNTFIYCPNCEDENPSQRAEDAAYNGDKIECRACKTQFFTLTRLDSFGDYEYKPVK